MLCKLKGTFDTLRLIRTIQLVDGQLMQRPNYRVFDIRTMLSNNNIK